MKLDEALPAVFNAGNICMLDGYLHRTVRTPPRTVGSREFSVQLSPMTTHELVLRLDGALHLFEESRSVVRYLGSTLPTGVGLKDLKECKERVAAIRRTVTSRELTMLLVDEILGKALAVIGETLTWSLDGLDVKFVDGRGTELTM